MEEIGVLAEPIAHTYKIKIGIINKNMQIKPGMICEVLIDKNNQSAGLYVASRAVLIDELGENFVFVVKQNKVEKRYVETGKLLKSGVEITNGLKDEEHVVITGQQKLVDNSSVRIVNK